jgi:hypothetical protein
LDSTLEELTYDAESPLVPLEVSSVYSLARLSLYWELYEPELLEPLKSLLDSRAAPEKRLVWRRVEEVSLALVRLRSL